MPLSLAFDASHRYAAIDGIDVPIELRVGERKVELLARLDTGAAHCIFERQYAEALGLEVESGRAQRFRTMTGSFVGYEHEVTLHTLGIEFTAVVFFAEDPGMDSRRSHADCVRRRQPTRCAAPVRWAFSFLPNPNRSLSMRLAHRPLGEE